jgi:hypothetical protein
VLKDILVLEAKDLKVLREQQVTKAILEQQDLVVVKVPKVNLEQQH